jgi:hypothetical protein
MRFLRAFAIAAAVSTASGAEIPAGTHLLLRMEHSVSSRSAKVGDGIHLRTSVPISAGGRIVVPIGSYAQGVISAVKRGKRAELQIQLMTLMLPSGEVLAVFPKTSSIGADAIRPAGRPGLGAYPGAGPLGLAVAGAIAGGQIGARAGLGVGAAVVLISAIAGHRYDVELRQGSAVDVVFERPAVLE